MWPRVGEAGLHPRNRLDVGGQVHPDHLGTALHRDPCGGAAGGTQPDHHHTATLEARRAQRSFRVERATRARMMLMIQNRTMILGSDHPFFS